MKESNRKSTGFRDTIVYDLPILADIGILRIEKAIIRFPRNDTIDIGALCYLRRSNKRRISRLGGDAIGRVVDITSLSQARCHIVRRILAGVSTLARNGSYSWETLRSIVRNWLRFIDWCDSNSVDENLTENDGARIAFSEYSEHLLERIRRETLKQNTASRYQKDVLALFRDHLDIAEVARGVRSINASLQSVAPTQVADENMQRRVLSVCESMFSEFSTFVLGGANYPFKFSVPSYLGWPVDHLWVFPIPRWVMTPSERHVREELGNGHWCYDYENGRLAQLDEIVGRYCNPFAAKRSLELAKANLSEANKDKRHSRRQRLAILAHNAFALMFAANTGINYAQLRALRWNKHYEVGKESQGFCEIKSRASGKLVSFTVEARFLSKFKQFLKLREYLIGSGNDPEHLFIGKSHDGELHDIGKNLFWRFFGICKRLDPELENIGPRIWRACKSDWLVRNTDIGTAALVLQNTEATVQSAYTAGSETQSQEEFSHYFSELASRILQFRDQELDGIVRSSVGACSDFGQPLEEEKSPQVSDCRQPEGCLFCSKYVVHADDLDIRKLMSLRYCITRTAHLSDSVEHFDSMYGSVLDRIAMIISLISDVSEEHKDLVARVQVEVEEVGQLDPYWGAKLDAYEFLGVVQR